MHMAGYTEELSDVPPFPLTSDYALILDIFVTSTHWLLHAAASDGL